MDKKIRSLLKENGDRIQDLANALGVSQGTVSNWINIDKRTGRPRRPGVVLQDKICEYYGISRSELYSDDVDFYKEKHGSVLENKPWMIPIFLPSQDFFSKYFNEKGQPVTYSLDGSHPFASKDPNAFFIRVSGENLVGGDIKENDLLLIEPNNRPFTEELCVYRIEDTCAIATFKKDQKGNEFLVPLNKKLDPVVLDEFNQVAYFSIAQLIRDKKNMNR